MRTLRFASASVFPKQTLLPPWNGIKLVFQRFLPVGVKLSGLSWSNLSGRNSVGRCHSAGLCPKAWKFMNMRSPSKKLYFPSLVSFVVYISILAEDGGWIRSPSFMHIVTYSRSCTVFRLTFLARNSCLVKFLRLGSSLMLCV